MALLEVSNLQKSFADKSIFAGIDLQVEQGEIVVILGPSGSGKSTFLRCLNLLETPDAGVITLDDAVFNAAKPTKPTTLSLRRKTAFVFQNYALFRNKTALENITEALLVVKGLSKESAREKGLAILKQVGMEDFQNAWPSSLSGGQQQRIGIGRAMALEPALLLFDEPTSALDPERVGDILQLMKRLAADNQSMIIVTHEIPFAREVADRVIFIDEGRIIEAGPPSEVLDNPKDARTQQFLKQVLH